MRQATPRRLLPLLILLAAGAVAPDGLAGQYRISAPSGTEVAFSRDELTTMLDTTRALRTNLEEDPRVLYFTGTGPAVTETSPDAAYPWRAVEVLADSVATIQTPANLREADRAYANYAVLRMLGVRDDPDVSCDSLMSREVAAVSAFADGWIVTRTLFGGPPFPPLDEIVFARQAGVLAGMIAQKGDLQLGGCLDVWREAHPEAVEDYLRWRGENFRSRSTAGGGYGSREQIRPAAL